MARVTIAEVKEIIETTREDAEITAVITAANLVVTSKVGSSTLVSTALAKELERWLAAHMLAATVEQQPVEEAIGPLKFKYASLGELLQQTYYGSQVLIMDPTGSFASAGKKSVKLRSVTSFET